MKSTEILLAIYIGLFSSLMLGPVFIMLIQTSASRGIKAGFAFNLGACFSDIFYVLISLSLSSKILFYIRNQIFLYIIGALAMIIYGLILILKRYKEFDQQNFQLKACPNNYFGIFLKGILISFLSFRVFGFWTAIVLFMTQGFQMDKTQILIFFIVVFSSYMIFDVPKMFFARLLEDRLTRVNINKIRRVTGFMLIFFGLIFSFQYFYNNLKDLWLFFISD